MIKKISEILSNAISIVLETNWGYSAIHPDVAPSDFIKPGGNEKDDHRSIIDGMKDSEFVLE